MTRNIPVQQVINRIPYVKPSYDINANKKVSCDYYMAIPFGKKYLAWFTHYENQNVCVLLQVDIKQGEYAIRSAAIRRARFAEPLALNTILFGTVVNNRIFCVEDIHMYKNKLLKTLSHQAFTNRDKLALYSSIFEGELRQSTGFQRDLVFALAPMGVSFKELLATIPKLPYKVYGVRMLYYDSPKQHRLLYREGQSHNQVHPQSQGHSQGRVFEVRANLQTDIYDLYSVDPATGVPSLHDHAYVPDYNTSKLLNGLFRTIKENANLDAIEESDDEEDFENVDLAKNVDLEKRVLMRCVLHSTFRKWVPVEVVPR